MQQVMDIAGPIVLICVGIALVVLVIELIKLLRSVRTTVTDITEKVNPMLDDVSGMVKDLRPTVVKVEPMVDRVQLTLDAVNLEMMRVDEILEDVSQITDAAASATSAVDTITNAPIKAVNSVSTKVRTAFGSKSASDESMQLGGQRDAVARALEDYKAAQDEAAGAVQDAAVADASLEPNFDGFEKLVSDAEPETLENEAEASVDEPAETVSAEGIFGEAEGATAELEPVGEKAE